MNDRFTHLLARISDGNQGAIDEILPTVYSELRRIARSRMAHEPAGQTLQPTALVHEAYLRLIGNAHVGWQDRSYFYAAAAEAMRRILIERARRYSRLRHGGDLERQPLEDDVAEAKEPEWANLLALDAALKQLEARDSRMSEVVKLRFFAGLSVAETAQALQIAPRSVNRLWTSGRAWLGKTLDAPPSL